MTTTQERPVISDEEFDKEMFHELKDKFEFNEDGEDHGSDGAKEW